MRIENSKQAAFGFWVEFSIQNWEIVISIGYIFGRVYISFDHAFLYRNFRKTFTGDGFGEWGREIGFMIERKYMEYSLFWYSDPNKPPHKWRSKYFIS